jgi:hypothetical protein
MEPESLDCNLDDNTYLIAKSIFTANIQKPKFYSLQLEPENEGNSLKIAEIQGVDKYIQNILSIITVYGIELLYSHRDINKLTESQLQTVKMYVKSYGYILHQEERENLLYWVFKPI